MKRYPYVILGGGLVAGYAAQAFVENGLHRGELCIVSAEPHLPYERPPLSKDFLRGTCSFADILINPPDFYTEHGIDVLLAAPIEQVDFANKLLYCHGEPLAFDKLLLATGARPRRLTLPGADLDGIYYLRQVEEAQQIQQAATQATTAIVIGNGFIGMEVTSVLQQMNIATTLLFPEPHLGEHVFTTRMATFFEDYYQQRGVTILPHEKVVGFVSDNDHVTHVSLASGKDLPTDMVVVGIGITPNIELFADTELQIDNGIVINHFLETNLPNIYAAGDVACYRDLLYNRLRHVEHWDNAVAQGKHAARSMVGCRAEYVHVPYVFSTVFGRSYEMWGDAEEAEQVVYRGDVTTGCFSVWWLSTGGHLLAVFVMNRPEEEGRLAQQWIQEGRQLNADLLRDETQRLRLP